MKEIKQERSILQDLTIESLAVLVWNKAMSTPDPVTRNNLLNAYEYLKKAHEEYNG